MVNLLSNTALDDPVMARMPEKMLYTHFPLEPIRTYPPPCLGHGVCCFKGPKPFATCRLSTEPPSACFPKFLGTVLGSTWAQLGADCPNWGPTWGQLGPTSSLLEPYGGAMLGLLWANVRSSVAETSPNGYPMCHTKSV